MNTETTPAEQHPIERYIAARRVSDPKFSKQALADQVGVSRLALYRVINGDDAVSTDLLEKIETATDREITAVELFTAWKAARDRLKAATT